MPPTFPELPSRRACLAHAAWVGASLAACGIWPTPAAARQALAAVSPAFAAHGLGPVWAALDVAAPVESAEVELGVPDIAENGAVVPVTLATRLPGARQLLLLVEHNPTTLSAIFELGDAVEPSLTLRVKMAESSNVYAVALTADGRAYFARKEVAVILGGCTT